jgi:hypothetical protein
MFNTEQEESASLGRYLRDQAGLFGPPIIVRTISQPRRSLQLPSAPRSTIVLRRAFRWNSDHRSVPFSLTRAAGGSILRAATAAAEVFPCATLFSLSP